MEVHELFRYFRMPELIDIRQYVRTLPTNTLMGFGAFAALTTFWYATRPKALKPPCDLSMQSVEIAGTTDGIRRSAVLEDDKLLVYYYDDVRTMYDGFQRGIQVSNNGPCLGSRKPNQPYEWISYKEVAELAECIGSGLIQKGFKPCSEQFIGLFSQNRPEDLGRVNRVKPKPPEPEDLAIICFTSGTTGNPKGAMITHQNIINDCSGFIKATESALTLNASDTQISYLPLAHMYEQQLQCVMLCHGAKIGFFQGDIRLLMDDLKVLQPTIFPVVPRLLNRMFDRIFGQANTSLKRWLLDFASKRKEAELRSGIVRNNSLWDKLIFHKIQSSLGGKVRLMITGAAPVSATVLTFLRTALGCQFYEGYGQTECTAGCCLSLPGDWTAGHVGAPMPCNYVKLVDVEEMNYLASKGEGEVCVKGANVFKGYLKDPARTAEALDKDGWLHTGDIGKWLPNGTLKIIDRKKHIFKLAQGEYIAPEKIENIYLRSEAVAQVFVHGESLQAFLIAVVVPDVESLPSWAQKRGLQGSFEELCRNKDINKAILDDLLKLGKEAGLKPFEQVKGIAVHPELFSIDNGLLTPTLKAKRPELRNYFRSQIDELYATIKI